MGFPLVPFFESNVLSSVDVNNRTTAILDVAFVKAGRYADLQQMNQYNKMNQHQHNQMNLQ